MSSPARPPSPRPARGTPAGLLVGRAAWLAAAVGAIVAPGCSGPPPPSSIAADPVLARGFAVYGKSCASCHGPAGRGDGPNARNLAGPAMRDLAAGDWRHGAAPGRVVAVLTDGVKDSAMPAYGGTYGPADLRATAAYVYHLAGRPVPDELRTP